MKFSSVLVVTYGRSGSTLLQGILNSIDGCVVRGENYNLCYGLFSAYKSLMRTKNEYGLDPGAKTPISPWFGAWLFDEQRFVEDARQLLFRQLLGGEPMPRCIGFKEIRYADINHKGEIGDTELQAYLDFLGLLFPNPAFVFLTRAHAQVMKSAWWQYKEGRQVESQLSKFEACNRRYCTGKGNVFTIDFNDIVSCGPRLHELFVFLGAEYDSAVLESVLSTEHSYPAKPTRVGIPEKHGGCQVDYVEMVKDIVFFQLDNSAPKRSPQGLYVLSGLAVLAPGCEQGLFHLVAVDSQGIEHEAIWRMESPYMEKEYPSNPNAANSRFRVGDLQMQSQQPVVLYLENATGQRERLLSVVLP